MYSAVSPFASFINHLVTRSGLPRNRESGSWQGKEVFTYLLPIAQTGWEEDFYSGIRQPKCEADHSFPSTVEVKKEWM